ncbi:hypothetical protein ACQ4WY_01535 [Janthinobacterium sp. LB2P49]|uniref:hypothetical protein n=1 Tax=Janthinobacterium sp. LB2P49 TaxID=3424198 RepID=UPI003F2906F9
MRTPLHAMVEVSLTGLVPRHDYHCPRSLRPIAAAFRRLAAGRLRQPGPASRSLAGQHILVWQHRLQREASRKLIRSCNILRQDGDPCWPASLDEHAALLLRHYPAMQAPMAYFLAQARPGAAPASGFTPALRQFTQWLAQQHSS